MKKNQSVQNLNLENKKNDFIHLIPNALYKIMKFILNNPRKTIVLGLTSQVAGNSALNVNRFQNHSSFSQDNLTNGLIFENLNFNNSLSIIQQRNKFPFSVNHPYEYGAVHKVKKSRSLRSLSGITSPKQGTGRTGKIDIDLTMERNLDDCIDSIQDQKTDQMQVCIKKIGLDPKGNYWPDRHWIEHDIEVIIQNIYFINSNPSSYYKINKFVEEIPTILKTGVFFTVLLKEMKNQGDFYSPHILDIAYKVKTYMELEDYQTTMPPRYKKIYNTLKSNLPSNVKTLIWDKFYLKSRNFNEYIYQDKDDCPIFSYTTSFGVFSSPIVDPDSSNVWELEAFKKEPEYFFIKTSKQKYYLYGHEKHNPETVERRHVCTFTRKSDHEQGLWKIEPQDNKFFRIKMYYNDLHSEYLYSSVDYYNQNRLVFTWNSPDDVTSAGDFYVESFTKSRKRRSLSNNRICNSSNLIKQKNNYLKSPTKEINLDVLAQVVDCLVNKSNNYADADVKTKLTLFHSNLTELYQTQNAAQQVVTQLTSNLTQINNEINTKLLDIQGNASKIVDDQIKGNLTELYQTQNAAQQVVTQLTSNLTQINNEINTKLLDIQGNASKIEDHIKGRFTELYQTQNAAQQVVTQLTSNLTQINNEINTKLLDIQGNASKIEDQIKGNLTELYQTQNHTQQVATQLTSNLTQINNEINTKLLDIQGNASKIDDQVKGNLTELYQTQNDTQQVVTQLTSNINEIQKSIKRTDELEKKLTFQGKIIEQFKNLIENYNRSQQSSRLGYHSSCLSFLSSKNLDESVAQLCAMALELGVGDDNSHLIQKIVEKIDLPVDFNLALDFISKDSFKNFSCDLSNEFVFLKKRQDKYYDNSGIIDLFYLIHNRCENSKQHLVEGFFNEIFELKAIDWSITSDIFCNPKKEKKICDSYVYCVVNTIEKDEDISIKKVKLRSENTDCNKNFKFTFFYKKGVLINGFYENSFVNITSDEQKTRIVPQDKKNSAPTFFKPLIKQDRYVFQDKNVNIYFAKNTMTINEFRRAYSG